MKKEDFNIYEFHQKLRKKVDDANEEEEWNKSKAELLYKLESELSFYEEQECNHKLKEIENKIYLYETSEIFFYRTHELIEEYKKILNCTVKDSFTKKRNSTFSAEKLDLVERYISILKNFPELEINLPSFNTSHEPNRCQDCNQELTELESANFVCKGCGLEYPSFYQDGANVSEQIICYKDLTRINTNVKYSYIRQTHFKDTIKQFQGRQNKYIDPKVYECLENSFEANQINEKNKNGKYTKITKDHIKMFLQEHSLYKYYEDINLIYYELTGHPCPNIQEYEKILIEDFDKLVVVYDKVIHKENKYNRSNFLNSYYILYQLLKRHSYPCKETDFPLIKTIDRKIEHDEIYEECCKQLGWFFYATV